MYLYFDVNGNLKEIVDYPVRKNSIGVNVIYAYVENSAVPSDNEGTFELPTEWNAAKVNFKALDSDENLNPNSGTPVSMTKVTKQIPQTDNRDLYFFKPGFNYEMWSVEIPSTVTLPDDITDTNFEVLASIILVNTVVEINGENPQFALNTFAFNVERGVGVKVDSTMTQSQYSFLYNKIVATLGLFDASLLRIVTTAIGSVTLSEYENGQILYSTVDDTFYKVTYNVGAGTYSYSVFSNGILGSKHALLYYECETTDVVTNVLPHNRLCAVKVDDKDLLCYLGEDDGGIDFSAMELYNNKRYYYAQISSQTFATVLSSTTYTYATKKSNGQLTVPATPLISTDAASKGYVDDQIQASIESLGYVFNYRGSFSVSYINTNLTSDVLTKGDVVNVTDSGTLTLGNVSVIAGDNVVWDGSAWDKLAGTVDLSGYVPYTGATSDVNLGRQKLTLTYSDSRKAEIYVDHNGTHISATGSIWIHSIDNNVLVPTKKIGPTNYTSEVANTKYVDTYVYDLDSILGDNDSVALTESQYIELRNGKNVRLYHKGIYYGRTKEQAPTISNIYMAVDYDKSVVSDYTEVSKKIITLSMTIGSENPYTLSLTTDTTDFYNKTQADSKLSGKLDKSSSTASLYAVDGSGNQTMIQYGAGAVMGRIPQRVENGNINVAETPTNDAHAASKKYVDAVITELNELKLEFYEAVVDIQTKTYAYLSLDAIGTAISTQPIIFSAGADVVNIKGNSFVYNQIINKDNFSATDTINDVAFTNNGDGTFTVNGTASADVTYTLITNWKWNSLTYNHSQLWIFNGFVSGMSIKNDDLGFYWTGGANTKPETKIIAVGTDYKTWTWNSPIKITVASGTSISNIKISFMSIDLTQAGITASTADEAIAELAKRGIDVYQYNAYNTGTIINSQANKLTVNGFNLFDKNNVTSGKYVNPNNGALLNSASNSASDFIKVIPGATYYLKSNSAESGTAWCAGYSEANESSYVSAIYLYINGTRQIPVDVHYIRMSLNNPYLDEYCLSISNASLNGTYKPYITPSEYPLTLPVMRSAGSVKDDVSKVRVGYVDLGTLSWSLNNANIWQASFTGATDRGASAVAPATCSNYASQKYNDLTNNVQGIWYDNSKINVNNGSTTTQPTGMLYYELATPTDQSAITLPTDLTIEKGGSLQADYTSPNTTPSDFDIQYATSKIVEE